MVQTANILFILGAWVFWGTYPVPFKSPAAKKANCDPFAFQFMKSSLVFITSWLILTWRPFTFTYWGFVGAAIWIPSGLLFISAVKLTGVAFATPIANGVQVIVSFCWGAFYFKEPVHNAGLSVLAMFIMILGMIGISISVNWETIKAARLAKQQQQSIESQHSQYASINVTSNQADFEKAPLLYGQPQPQYDNKVLYPVDGKPVVDTNNIVKSGKTKAQERREFILGICASIIGGFFGGTQNVPLKNAPEDAHGIQYVISFGIGAVIVIAVWTAGYLVVRYFMKMGLPTVNLKISIVPGSIAGLLWSCGNVCNIYATLAYGATVGFPLVMCNMMVAGLWGVFYYNEAPNPWMKVLFIFSCLTLLGGVTLLSVYG